MGLVDEYSWGMTVLAMLWCAYNSIDRHGNELFRAEVVPLDSQWEDGGDPRVPQVAVDLLKQVTSDRAADRGTMRQHVDTHAFFKDFSHEGETFSAINMDLLLRAAER